jgi:hypothetical protein
MEHQKDNALHKLRDLDYQIRKEKYSHVPDYAITKRHFDDTTSNGLTNCIISWLLLKGHYATRVTTTGRQIQGAAVTDVIGRTRIMKSTWIPGTTRKGTADVHASINGKHVSIEVKIGRDKMSEKQLKTKEIVEASGGLYYIAHSFTDFLEFYKTL